MSQQQPHIILAAHSALDARQTHILDAAERCFARGGFHRTTMADVAREAGMSAGNIYRYFPSKDAVVERLCERDRSEIAEGMQHLISAEDPFTALSMLGHHHLVDEPREKAVLVAELWAEAMSNPAIAAMIRGFDDEIRARLTNVFAALRQRGLFSAAVDIEALVATLMALVDGVVIRRAREADFDPRPFVARIDGLVRAAAAGELSWLNLPAAAGKEL